MTFESNYVIAIATLGNWFKQCRASLSANEKQEIDSDICFTNRSTTVYLADRRFDMLPEVLSADLCSLIGGVDR